MKKINMNDDISIYANIENQYISMENRKVSKIVDDFYNLLKNKDIDIRKLKNVKIIKMVINKKDNISVDAEFVLRGYAKEKFNNDENLMRNYFNIGGFKIENLYKQLKYLYKDYLYYLEMNKNKIEIILENLYIIK